MTNREPGGPGSSQPTRRRAFPVGIVVTLMLVMGVVVAGFFAFSAIGSPFGAPSDADAAIDEGSAVPDLTAGSGPGTWENPLPLGSPVEGENWSVLVTEVTRDADAIVAAADSSNRPAPSGSHYETVSYTATYTGTTSGFASEIDIQLVTSSDLLVNSDDSLVTLADEIAFGAIAPSESASGSQAFIVPDGDEVLVVIHTGDEADSVFVSP